MKVNFATSFSKSVDLWRRARITGGDEEVFENSGYVMAQLSCFVESRLRQGILDLSAHQIFKNNARDQKAFYFTCFGFRVRLRVGCYFQNKQILLYHLHLHLLDPSTRAVFSVSADYALDDDEYVSRIGYDIEEEGAQALFGLMKMLSSVCS